MTAGPRTWSAAVALAALALGTAAFVRAHAAPAPWQYFAYDQQAYLAMARAPFAPDAQVHHPPFAWRVAAPLVAGAIGRVAGGAERGFLVLSFATFALLPLAAWWWLETLGASRTAALTGAGAMAVAPPLVGLLAWDVARVDAPAVLTIFLAAIATVRARAGWMCLAIVAAALTKETVVTAACFALAWAICVERRLLGAAVAATALAVAARAVVQWTIVPSPQYAFRYLGVVGVVAGSLSPANAARRLLLSTAGTWNVLVPFVAAAMAARRWGGREVALTAGLAMAMSQLIFATDNERVVAAAYPFVLAWAALQIDAIDERRRPWAGLAIVAAQLPWLLEMGRVWPAPPPAGQLPHVPPIRYVEMVIALAGVAAAAVAFLRRPTAQVARV